MDLTPQMIEWRKSGASIREIAKRVGRAKSVVQEAFTRTSQPRQSASRTLADFRRDHDQAWKIRDGLKHLFAGGVIMTDAEFREAVSGNPSRWRAAADQSEFREHRYRVGGELLWAAKDTIREMRKIRGEAV